MNIISELMAKSIVTSILLVITAHVTSALAAQQKIDDEWVLEEYGSFCAISNSYPIINGRFLYIIQRADGDLFVRIYQKDWSFRNNGTYSIRFQFDNATIDLVGRGASANDGAKGFLASFNQPWLDAIARSKSVVLATIGTNGADLAVASLQRCVVELRSKIGDLSKIPVSRAVPLGMPWITIKDYPTAAKIEERTGISVYRLSVDTKGMAIV
jgi:hypothetical protein